MDTWIKKLSGVFLASVLAVSLNGKANAEAAAPENETPPAIIEEADDRPAGEGGASAVDELNVPGAADEGLRGVSLVQNAPEGEGEGQDEAASAQIVIAGQEIDLVNGASSTAGWSYDATDGSLSLLNFNGSEQSLYTTACGVTVKAAGLNRLSTLSVDGDIHLIGSGILLVDTIEMPEGKSLELMPNKAIYGDDGGSVAVFLKQDDGSYLLINGDPDGSGIAALLDEAYTIPSGVTLVVPDGAKVQMQCLAVGKYTSEDGQSTSVYYSTESEKELLTHLPDYQDHGYTTTYSGSVEFVSSAPSLTISQGARLVVEKLASLVMTSLDRRHTGRYTATITAAGELAVDGSVSGGQVKVAGTGDLSGTGSFTASDIIVDGDRSTPVTTVSITDKSSVKLAGKGADLAALTVSGENELIYEGDSSIGSCKVPAGSTLDCYSTAIYGLEDQLSFRNGISGGGTMYLQSGIYVLEETCKITDGTALIAYAAGDPSPDCLTGSTAAIFDYYLDENGKANLTSSVVPRIETRVEDLPIPSTGTYSAVDTVLTKVFSSAHLDGSVSSQLSYLFDSGSIIRNYIYKKSELNDIVLDYATLKSFWESFSDPNSENYRPEEFPYYKENYIDTGETPKIVMETKSNGKWGVAYLSEETPDVKVPLRDVIRIHLVETEGYVDSGGGGTLTSTNVSFTGSGVLGGSGAGSVQGGNSTGVLAGSGLSSRSNVSNQGSGGNTDPNGNNTDPNSGNGNNTDPNSGNGNNTDPNGGSGNNTDPNGGNGNNTDPNGGSGNNTDPNGGNGNNTDPNDNNTDPNADPDGGDPGSGDDPDGKDPADDGTASGDEGEVHGNIAVQDSAAGGTHITVSDSKVYTLRIEGQAEALPAPTEVRMSFAETPPAAGESVYVVFRNSDGSLTAYKAVYDPVSGQLIFTTQRTGEFVVVCLHFEGEEFSDAFYQALKSEDAVKRLS